MTETRIGEIGNNYGDLNVFNDKTQDKYYWFINDWETWDETKEEIPKYLYDALMKFENEREKDE